MGLIAIVIVMTLTSVIAIPAAYANDPDIPQVAGIMQNEDGSWTIQVRFKGAVIPLQVPNGTVQQTASSANTSCPETQEGIAEKLKSGNPGNWEFIDGAWIYNGPQTTFTYPGNGTLDSWQGQNVTFSSPEDKGQTVTNDKATFRCDNSSPVPETTSTLTATDASSDPAVSNDGGKCRKLDSKAFLCESGALLTSGDSSGVPWTAQQSVNVDVWSGFQEHSCQVISQSKDAMRLSCEPGTFFTADKATVRVP